MYSCDPVDTPAKTSQFPTGNRRGSRSQQTDEVENIYGFRRSIEKYVEDKKMIKIKDEGSQLLKLTTTEKCIQRDPWQTLSFKLTF